MSKFKISNDIIREPINNEIIGKNINDVDVEIRDCWPITYKTDAKGENGYRCLIYQYDMFKAILIVDKDECVIDYFVYRLGQDTPVKHNK